HPNIISVLDYGFDSSKQPFFTMDLLESPKTILEAGSGQPVPTQLDLLAQTLQALVYLHRRGIIHRDLKPDNVLVVGNQVKVLDLGLAAARELLTQDGGGLAGTLAYIAPEILRGGTASQASDLYPVGIIAYQRFAGRHPFRTKIASQLAQDPIRAR